MSKRKYTHVQELEGEILAMRKEGATRQEIADRLGLSKSQIKIGLTGITASRGSAAMVHMATAGCGWRRRSWVSTAIPRPSCASWRNVDGYIHFYNHERIQLKTGEAPLAQRLSV